MVCHIELFKGTTTKLAFVKRAVTPMAKIDRENRSNREEIEEGINQLHLKGRRATRNVVETAQEEKKENVRPSLDWMRKLRS